MLAELEYVSVGCSRTPHAADWSRSGTLAYAAHESVALAREAEVRRLQLRLLAYCGVSDHLRRGEDQRGCSLRSTVTAGG